MSSKFKRFYVSFPDNDGPEGKTCGHQHDSVRKAVNCGGNAYRVIASPSDKDGNRSIEMTRVST